MRRASRASEGRLSLDVGHPSARRPRIANPMASAMRARTNRSGCIRTPLVSCMSTTRGAGDYSRTSPSFCGYTRCHEDTLRVQRAALQAVGWSGRHPRGHRETRRIRLGGRVWRFARTSAVHPSLGVGSSRPRVFIRLRLKSPSPICRRLAPGRSWRIPPDKS